MDRIRYEYNKLSLATRSKYRQPSSRKSELHLATADETGGYSCMMENLSFMFICDWAQLMSQLGIARHAVNCYSHLTKTRRDTINPSANADTRSLVIDCVLRTQGAAHKTQHIFLCNSHFKHFSFRAMPQLCQWRAHNACGSPYHPQFCCRLPTCLDSTHLNPNQNEQSNAELIYTWARYVRKVGKLLPDYMASQRWRQTPY